MFKTKALIVADSLSNRISQEADTLAKGGYTDLASLINQIIKVAVPASILVAVGLFAYAGYLMLTSQGNPDKLNEAKEVLVNAVIGLVIVILADVILVLIRDSLQIPTNI